MHSGWSGRTLNIAGDICASVDNGQLPGRLSCCWPRCNWISIIIPLLESSAGRSRNGRTKTHSDRRGISGTSIWSPPMSSCRIACRLRLCAVRCVVRKQAVSVIFAHGGNASVLLCQTCTESILRHCLGYWYINKHY